MLERGEVAAEIPRRRLLRATRGGRRDAAARSAARRTMCVHEPQAAAVAAHKAPRRSQLARWVVRQTRFLETKTAGEFIAELWGTALIVLFGCGVVCAALSGAQAGIWQVAVVWWLGVSLAIYTTAHVSGAHLNPAITIALATLRDFEWSKVPHYIAAQLLGGILGGALNLMIFNGIIHHYERSNGIVRGEPESILTAAAFGEYFPNPYLYAHTGEADGACARSSERAGRRTRACRARAAPRSDPSAS